MPKPRSPRLITKRAIGMANTPMAAGARFSPSTAGTLTATARAGRSSRTGFWRCGRAGLKRLKVLDIGCGPGTWLRRVVVRARQIGFEEIIARGVDIAEAQLHRARLLSRGLCELKGVQLTYGYGDLRGEIDAPQADICLCLYGVLNHVPVADLPDVMGRMAALTAGYFIATVRAIGSQPTVYVDEVSAARSFHQDNLSNRLDVEFANGRRASFQSHLFSRTELTRLVSSGAGSRRHTRPGPVPWPLRQ